MKQPTQFLTNEKGERIAAVISEKLLEDLEDIRAIEEAKVSGEAPLEQALAELEGAEAAWRIRVGDYGIRMKLTMSALS